MVAKDVAKQVIDALPQDATLEEIIRALYVRVKSGRGAQGVGEDTDPTDAEVRAMIEHAERQIEEGRGVPHEEAKLRLRKWLR